MKSDKVIIIKCYPLKESDLVVKGLSSEQGIVSYFAKGALNSKKRFNGGVLEPANYIEVTLNAKTSNASLKLITEAKLLEGFEKLRTDYGRLSLAIKVLTYFDRLSVSEADARSLFFLLGHTLRAISVTNNLIQTEVQFIAKFLYEQGVLETQGQEHMQTYVASRYQDNLSNHLAQQKEDLRKLLQQLDHYIKLFSDSP